MKNKEELLRPFKSIFVLILKQLEECIEKDYPITDRIEILTQLTNSICEIEPKYKHIDNAYGIASSMSIERQ